MALRFAGLGCEDALIDPTNYVWPNIFETSLHVTNAAMEAIEGMRVALGAAIVFRDCSIQQGRSEKCTGRSITSLYIGAQDALVAASLVLEDEKDNVFCRSKLHVFV
ncbi:UNVERIFIED_CONTAM: Splicing factor 3B subunit 1 [Sesamum indicum]